MTQNGAYKAAVFAALTGLHEKWIKDVPLFGCDILIRELSAKQRTMANDAATADDPENPDNALYRGILIQQCVVNPETGQPYADGRVDEQGKPAIDPRTRAPLFTADEVAALVDGRSAAVNRLIDEITALAMVRPLDFKSVHSPPDSGQSGEGAGAGDSGEASRGPDG